MRSPSTASPDPETRDWVEETVGSARVVAARRLTGIVDWPFASMGPREIDVGHCRLNLAYLFSVDWAERLRAAYEAETGHVLDPWWDIHAIWSFHDVWQEFIPKQVGGRIPVDLNGMCRRVDEIVAAPLRRT